MFFDNGYGLARVLVVGPLAYLSLILLLRASGNRTLSKMNAFDLVVTVALGSTLATILLTERVALAEGVLGFAVLIGLQYMMTWLSVRCRLISRIIKGEPVLLARRGELCGGAMRRQRVVAAEVLQAVREAGAASLDETEAVVLETDGTFSVVKKSADTGEASALDDVARRGGPTGTS